MALEDGYGLVSPKNQETARALLAAAEAVGEPAHVVRSTIGGYIAPVKVVKKYEDGLGAKKEEPVADEENSEDVPSDSWKVADIKAWAESHEVDLGDATKKADLLAAIQAHKED